MKKRLLITLMLLVAIVTGVNAKDYILGNPCIGEAYYFNASENPVTLVYDGDNLVGWKVEKDGLTLTALKGSGTQVPIQDANQNYVLYSGNTLTVTSATIWFISGYYVHSKSESYSASNLVISQTTGFYAGTHYVRYGYPMGTQEHELSIQLKDNAPEFSIKQIILDINNPPATDYYLIGNLKGLDITESSPKFVANPNVTGEYILQGIVLQENEEIKVRSSEDEWFNDGGSFYKVNTTGVYDIHFNPEGNSNWDYWYMYAEYKGAPSKYIAVVYCEGWGSDDISRKKQFDFDASGKLTYTAPGASYVFIRNDDTGVQYCTDGWTDYSNPVTLVNQNSLSNPGNFEKFYVPSGEHTLYLQDNGDDTFTIAYDNDIRTKTVYVYPKSVNTVGEQVVLWSWPLGDEGRWTKGIPDDIYTECFRFEIPRSHDNCVVCIIAETDPIAWDRVEGKSNDLSLPSEKDDVLIVFPTFAVPILPTEITTIDHLSDYTTPAVHEHTPANPVEENVSPPSCEGEGSYDLVVYCSECGEELSREQSGIPALGHDWGDWTETTPPTCEGQGTRTRTCSRDASHVENEDIPALGHDWGDWTETKSPTCIEQGTKTRTCSRDNSHMDNEDIPALGHDYTSVVTGPTCLEAGYTTFTCSRCGDTYVDNETPALGHNPSWVTNGDVEEYKCAVCGKVLQSIMHHPEETATACESFTWRGQTLTASGVYTDEEKNTQGEVTDVYRLNLTINNPTKSSQDIDVYVGDHYVEEGFDFTVTLGDGQKYYTTTNAAGCDSVVVLNLTVHEAETFRTDEVVEYGKSFEWRGKTYSEEGVYTDTVYTKLGGVKEIYILKLAVDTTKIDIVGRIVERDDAVWYTLDGRRLDARPTRRGLYLYRGRKVVVR